MKNFGAKTIWLHRFMNIVVRNDGRSNKDVKNKKCLKMNRYLLRVESQETIF